MSKYIDREAFKSKYLCCGYLPEMSEEEFDKFPAADVVPVVRCKDCGHPENGMTYGERWDRYFKPVKKADDYCSYRKRRER